METTGYTSLRAKLVRTVVTIVGAIALSTVGTVA